ncbi:hypothetical protein L596_007796 [Steinernema carpocapsae]|uniref:Uncharacterized protein n=1 Tax=Steinernema carpocapsae TaxID=34508 RepID=A0A4U5PAM8_STECR|nr:hypothetical protein L596_007796 [Steinernema carpocapsae]
MELLSVTSAPVKQDWLPDNNHDGMFNVAQGIGASLASSKVASDCPPTVTRNAGSSGDRGGGERDKFVSGDSKRRHDGARSSVRPAPLESIRVAAVLLLNYRRKTRRAQVVRRVVRMVTRTPTDDVLMLRSLKNCFCCSRRIEAISINRRR